VIAANAHTPLTDRPDVPLLKDLVTDPTDKKIAELMAGNMILGRGWLAPPGVPADRVAALRAAFKKALEDPEAIAGAVAAQDDVGICEVGRKCRRRPSASRMSTRRSSTGCR
jgi:hypothetical protein